MFPLDTYPGGGTPPVNPHDVGGTAVHAASHASTLPFTGSDVLTLVIVGVLLIVGGYLFYRVTRPVPEEA